jgi:hypothetical protein
MWQVTAYLECSYLDRGTLDVGLVLRTLVFCSALRVTSLLPTAGLARRGRRPSGGGRYFRLAELSLLSGAFLFYTISRGGDERRGDTERLEGGTITTFARVSRGIMNKLISWGSRGPASLSSDQDAASFGSFPTPSPTSGGCAGTSFFFTLNCMSKKTFYSITIHDYLRVTIFLLTKTIAKIVATLFQHSNNVLVL